MKPETRQLLFLQLLLVAITVLVFAPGMKFPLLAGWDDHEYILQNTGNLAFNGGMGIVHCFNKCYVGNYIPLTMLSYLIDYNLWGLSPLAFHLQNLFWHLVALLGFFHCLRYFKMRPWVAFFMALILAIHPQRCESVIWISERKDVLCAALYFWSIWFYLRDRNRKFSVAAFVLFALAMLAKPMAISLPVIFLLRDFHFRKDYNVAGYLKKLWPYILLALVFVPLTIYAQGAPTDKVTVLSRRLFAVFHNVIWYADYTLFPRNLSPIYPRLFISTGVLIKLLAAYVIAFGFISWLWIRHRREFIYSILPVILAYLAALAPVSGIFQLGSIDWADRYSYIPSAFIWFGVGMLISVWLRQKPAKQIQHLLVAFGVLYCVYLAVIAQLHIPAWQSYPAVLEAACDQEPANYMALAHYGALNFRKGDYDGAIALSDRTLNRRPGWLYPRETDAMLNNAHYVKGISLYLLGRKHEAAKELNSIRNKMTRNSFGSEQAWREYLKLMRQIPPPQSK